MADYRIGQKVEGLATPAGGNLARANSAIAEVDRKWIAVNVERYREADVSGRIGELGYLTYVPRFTVERRNPRKHRELEKVERPLFAGYLFARLSVRSDPWGSLPYVRGVIGLLGSRDKPAIVPDALIDELRGAEPANFGQAVSPIDNLAPNDRLRVTQGPFTEQVVLFVRRLGDLDGEGRIMALLDLFGRLTQIELSASQVERD